MNKGNFVYYYVFIYTGVVMEISQDVKDGINCGIGATSGFAVYKYAPRYILRPYGKYILSDIKKITKEENDIFWSSANKAYENSKLAEEVPKVLGPKIPTNKRTLILHIDSSNKKNIYKEILQRKQRFNQPLLTRTWLWKIIFGDPIKKFNRSVIAAADGTNAFCIPRLTDRSSLVVVNKDKMAFSAFHELGHAINAHSSGVKNFLSKTRGLFALGVPITLLVGLLSNKPKESNQKSVTDDKKKTNFIKDNCGLISTLLLLPMVIEEGLASINGAKLAKNVLDKNMYKKLNKLNTKAWLSYLLATFITGLTVHSAVKIKDKIVDYKPIK